MPSSWDMARLENVKVADNAVSVSYEKSASKTSISIQQENPGWTIELRLPRAEDARFETSGKAVKQVEENGFMIFTTEEKELTLEIYQK